jgi:hypothetical protein
MAITEPDFEARYLDQISCAFYPDAQTLDGVEFRDAVQSFQFVPSSSVATVVGGTRSAVFTASSAATWTLQVKFLQDMENADSLLNYLLAHAGEKRFVRFIPNGGKNAFATVILTAPPIGGDIGSWLDATLTMGVKGAPQVAQN